MCDNLLARLWNHMPDLVSNVDGSGRRGDCAPPVKGTNHIDICAGRLLWKANRGRRRHRCGSHGLSMSFSGLTSHFSSLTLRFSSLALSFGDLALGICDLALDLCRVWSSK